MPPRILPHLLRLSTTIYMSYTMGLRRRIPVRLRKALAGIYGVYVFWRIGPVGTRLLGPRYRRSRYRIDLDVTWSCNLRCYHCNRSCQQAPTEEGMTLSQVRRFVAESVERKIPWEEIHIVGGEPTQHPEIEEIARLLIEYRDRHSPTTRIKLTTNGYGKRAADVLERLPEGVKVRNMHKKSPCQEYFVPFNVAPRDRPEYAKAEFRNACRGTRQSGIGLSPHGYYPCVVAGAIDRIFGFDSGRQSIPDYDDEMEEDLARFCSLCGFFRTNHTADPGDGPLMSETWVKAYEEYRQSPRKLRQFAEDGPELLQIQS
jgi:radical SAM family protein